MTFPRYIDSLNRKLIVVALCHDYSVTLPVSIVGRMLVPVTTVKGELS